MYDKAVNRCSICIYIPDLYKTQEICDSGVSEDLFMLVYCPDKYRNQRMCDEPVDDCPAALESIPDWLVTSIMLQTFHNVLLPNDDILFFNEDFSKGLFIANQRHILAVDLDEINHDNDNNFDEEDNDTLIHTRLLAWEKRKALKKRQMKS